MMQNFGLITGISNFNNETGWGRFNTQKGFVSGVAPNAAEGMVLYADAEYSIKYRNYQASSIQVEYPKHLPSIVKMLVKLKIPGLSKVAATKIVNCYGVETWGHLSNLDDLKRSGLTKKVAMAVVEYAAEHLKPDTTEIMAILSKADCISQAVAKKICDTVKVEVLKKSPFSLIGKITGFTFAHADAIWSVTHGNNNDIQRLKAAIAEAFRREYKNGHSGMTWEKMTGGSADLLGTVQEDVLEQIYETDESLGVENAPGQDEYYFMADVFGMEKFIADYLHSNKLAPLPIVTQSIGLSDEQEEAVHNAVNYPVSILTGAPGTGKTYTVKAICEMAKANGLTVILLAPTGKACRRMEESTGIDANTIHKFITNLRASDNSLIIIDEMSMASLKLFHDLLKKLPAAVRIVLVGDVDQLPSIEHGQVFRDLIESKTLPVTRLTSNYRSGGNGILECAAMILNGDRPDLTDDSKQPVSFVEKPDSEIAGYICGVIESNDQVLAPVKGILPEEAKQVDPGKSPKIAGTKAINLKLAQHVNPSDKRMQNLDYITVNDRVVNGVNDYKLDVMNGETGVVRSISKDGQSLEILYGGDKIVAQEFKGSGLALSYALTVHKAQGQEYDNVIIAIPEHAGYFLTRSLVYTAMTRAKKQVVFIGSRWAFDSVLSDWKRRNENRVTGLQHHLRAAKNDES